MDGARPLLAVTRLTAGPRFAEGGNEGPRKAHGGKEQGSGGHGAGEDHGDLKGAKVPRGTAL